MAKIVVFVIHTSEKSFSICIVQMSPLGLYCGTVQLSRYIYDEEAQIWQKSISDAYKTHISRVVPQPRGGGLMKSERELAT